MKAKVTTINRCAACGKLSPKHKQWVAPDERRMCSVWCFEALLGRTIMIDPTPLERSAMDYAGEQAGEYIEALGKSDMAAMSAEEWGTLINVVCSAYFERVGAVINEMDDGLHRLRLR